MKVKTGIYFTATSLYKTVSAMVISLLAISEIGPEKLGLWQAALLVKPYMGFIQLGLTEGLGRELPYLMGQQRMERVKRFASSAQFVTTCYTSICMLVALFLTFFVADGGEEKLIYATAGVFISTMFVDNYLSATYRSSHSFNLLSKVYIISSTFGLLLIPLIYLMEFEGYMILLLIHSLVSTALLVFYRPLKVKSFFDKPIYFENVKIGFPMMVLSFLRSIPDSYPRIFILFFISTTALGLTAPSNAVLMAFNVLPAALSKYIFPNLTFEYGKTNDKTIMWERIKRFSFQLMGLGILGLFSLFVIPYAIDNYFPKYEEAIYITMVSVIIGFFRMFSVIFNVFNTLKRFKEQFRVSVSRNILYLIIPPIFFFSAPQGSELLYIFLGVLLAEIIAAIVLFAFVHKVTHD
ncbi:MAG TPA: hypothetical protein VFM70_04115 [Salinimicrobium sp.]|nr:hypothetical protein [Salinimicrobium sp.]